MNIDSLISEIMSPNRAYKLHKLNKADYEFIMSLDSQCVENKSLTTRQCYAARVVLYKYVKFADTLSSLNSKKFKEVIDEDKWGFVPRVTVEKINEVRHIGDNYIALSFSGKPEITKPLMRHGAFWRNGYLIVPVTNGNLDVIISIIGIHRFQMDDSTEEYIALCMSSKDQQSHALLGDDGAVINVCDDDQLGNFILHVVRGAVI